MRFYAPEKIGRTRRLTPEGFLVCENVPIARTGTMLYGEGEVPIDPGKDGIIRIERDDATVFAEDTIASFLGKAVTLGHPSEDVGPDNWKALAKGVVHEPRRGSGEWDDCIVADLFVTDAEAIKKVLDDAVEVSCGYDADYEQIEPGRGRQTNIIGNHVALVENGRCGSRCAIGDQAMGQKKSWKDSLRDLLSSRRTADEELERMLAEAPEGEESTGGETHVHVHLNGAQPAEKTAEEPVKDEGEEDPIEARFAKIEAALASIAETVGKLVTAEKSEAEAHEDLATDEAQEEAGGEEEKPEDEDALEEGAGDPTRTTDAASVAQEIADVKARAEILAPGVKFPTFDAKMDRKKVRDSLCGLRRKALEAAKAGDARDIVAPLLPGDVRKMTCDAVSAAFVGASELVRLRNNTRVIGRDKATKDASKVEVKSISDINEANRKFWATRS